MFRKSISSAFHKFSSLTSICHSYHIHQLLVTVVSNCPDFLSLVDTFWGGFLSQQNPSHPSLSFQFYCVPSDWDCSCSIPPDWSLYEESTHITSYISRESFLFCFHENGWFFLDSDRKEGIGYIKYPATIKELEQFFRSVFMPSFFYLMQRFGIFPLHASAVALKKKGIILSGSSGQGKTTLLLQLLNSGFDYMADDIVLLQDHSHFPTMLSFPAPAKITAQTSEFFPELRSMIEQNVSDERGKYLVDLGTMFQCPPVYAADPVILLLPEVSPHSLSTVEPVSRMEAAIQCIPENTFISTLKYTRKNFNILSRLIQGIECYRVTLGQEMNGLGTKIMNLIAK